MNPFTLGAVWPDPSLPPAKPETPLASTDGAKRLEAALSLLADTIEFQRERSSERGKLSELKERSRHIYNPLLNLQVVDVLRCELELLHAAAQLALDALSALHRRDDANSAQVLAYAAKLLDGTFRDNGLDVPPAVLDIHDHLRRWCSTHNVRLDKFLRMDDRADFADLPHWRERLTCRQRRAPSPAPRKSASTLTTEVWRARELLAGRGILLVGGIPDPELEEAIAQALACPARHVALPHHASTERLVPLIRDPATAVVAVAIRISSHATLPAVAALCGRFGKVCVVLPAGWSPTQIAHAIVEQVGDQLGPRRKAA